MTGNDDHSVFRAALRGVKPLAQKQRAGTQRRKRPPAHGVSPRGRGAAQRVGGRTPVDRQTLRDLRRGRLRTAAEADLHGLTGAHALRVLEEFIATSVAEHCKCVRVVHGKGKRSGPGGPVLRDLVHRWLAQSDDVLAFAQALERDGGSGAVYVLLER
jgi:DNA-nicking Smr family endonuclease